MLSRTKKPIDFWPNACVCKVCFVRFIQRFIIKPPSPPPSCNTTYTWYGCSNKVWLWNCLSSLYCMGGFQQMGSVTRTCCGCGTEVYCCHSLVYLEWKGKTDFLLVVALNTWRSFSCLLWLCFGLTLQGKALFVWLIFVRDGLFLMGSENRNRGLISF